VRDALATQQFRGSFLMCDSIVRHKISAQIRPFPRIATYPTSWGGDMTFEQIRDSLTLNINRLMRYYRYVEVDIPDMMAHGFMSLWEKLAEQTDFLTTVDHGGAIKWVMYRSGISQRSTTSRPASGRTTRQNWLVVMAQRKAGG
jgi:hypothetical protein